MSLLLPHHDFYPILKRSLYERWQYEWGTKTTYLRSIKSTLAKWTTSNRKSRREEVVLARLRICHTRLTHGHIFAGNLKLRCENLTVFHIIIECSQNEAVRASCFPSVFYSSISEINSSFDAITIFLCGCIFKFLKMAKLY